MLKLQLLNLNHVVGNMRLEGPLIVTVKHRLSRKGPAVYNVDHFSFKYLSRPDILCSSNLSVPKSSSDASLLFAIF
jgi:hypothetical protein